MRTTTPWTLKTLQVLPNAVCTRISFFVSKTVREIRAFFLSTTKIQLKRVNHKLSRRTIDAPCTGRVREASSGPYRVGSANFSQRKIGHAHDNFADSEKRCRGSPTDCARAFHFSFRKRSGKSELFFYPRPKYSWNESTTSSAGRRLTRHEQGVSAKPQAALRKSLIQHG